MKTFAQKHTIVQTITAIFLLGIGVATAQQLNQDTYWFGNTFSGKEGPATSRHVQNEIEDIHVYDGSIYTISEWDEAGREGGIYDLDGIPIETLDETHGGYSTHGSHAVVADDNYVYAAIEQSHSSRPFLLPPITPIEGRVWYVIRRYNHDGTDAPFPGGVGRHGCMVIINDVLDTVEDANIKGLAIWGDELFVTSERNRSISVYGISDMAHKRTFPITLGEDAKRITFDASGNLWVIQKRRIRKYDRNGNYLSKEITGFNSPVDLAFDSTGDLLVAHNAGHYNRVETWDVSGTPVQLDTFGELPYKTATPGLVQDDTFWNIRAIDVDTEDNLYVATSTTIEGNGDLKLRKFDMNKSLIWTLDALEFTECGDADPANDGHIYSRDCRFEVLLGEATADSVDHPQWTHVAWTINPELYPNDPRVLSGSACKGIKMLRLDGEKLMVTTPKQDGYLCIFRFDGEIAVPAVVFYKEGGGILPNAPTSSAWYWIDDNGDGDMQAGEYRTWSFDGRNWAMDVDIQGNVWMGEETALGIHKFEFEGFNGHGVPTYSNANHTEVAAPSDITRVKRSFYDPDTDRMYLGVWTDDNPYNGNWGALGSEIRCYADWSTSPTLDVHIVLDPDRIGRSMAIEGDYIFSGYSERHHFEIDIFSAWDGSYKGYLIPTEEVGNRSGWLDKTYMVQTQQRSDGSYLIIAEEVHRAKNLIFLWDPEAPEDSGLDCLYFEQTGMDSVNDLSDLKWQTERANFDITPRDRDDNFGFIFDGYLDVQTAGTYTFYTTSDDGSVLFIGDTLVVDNDGLHGSQERSGDIVLTAVHHPIQVQFFERQGGQVLEVEWEGPGISKQEIPDERLSRSNDTPMGIFSQDSGSDGIASMEAEHYSAKRAGVGAYAGMDWSVYEDVDAASGSYMMVPGTGANAGSSPDAPVMDFTVDFVKTGEHTIWVRALTPGGANDSCTPAYNGTPVVQWHMGGSYSWTWKKCGTTFVASPGHQTFSIQMREDGTKIDKIVLTVNPAYDPSTVNGGLGPDETLY